MATATKKKKSEKIAVSKIEIVIGSKVVTLTLEEMRELREVLDDTFPKEKTVYVPGAPVIIEKPVYPERDWPWRRWREPYWLEGPNVSGTGAPGGTLRLTCESKM